MVVLTVISAMITGVNFNLSDISGWGIRFFSKQHFVISLIKLQLVTTNCD